MQNKVLSIRAFIHLHPLITGTLWLTGAGLLSRMIGFFYRIYLSRLFGEEGMGIYQLIHPLSALAFSLTAGAFQTVISKFVSGQVSNTGTSDTSKSIRPLILGAALSLPLSLIISFLMYTNADLIATYYLKEPRTTTLIHLLSFSIPFCAAHACINGYFYGIKEASVPAWTQLIEQFFRVGTVYILSTYVYNTQTQDISIAVLGLIMGEFAGFFISLLLLIKKVRHTSFESSVSLHAMFTMLLPLAANRILLNLLQSYEATLLPSCLKAFGYDTKTSLSVYGVLTGMAFPLIFFPTALTGSISVLLLPVISENISLRKFNEIKKTILQTIQYCSIMGFACMAFFLFFSKTIGIHLFHSSLAGFFIGELSFLCPFLYLNNTLSGIIQGLGKASALFIINFLCLLIRLLMTFFLVPQIGIQGYLWGLLVGQILQTILYLCVLFLKSIA